MIKTNTKALYMSPINEVIEEAFLNAPLCASQDEGFVIDDRFEDDGTF